MSTVQYPRKTWLATGSMLTIWWRMPSLGLRFSLAFQLWLSPACLCLWQEDGPVRSQLVFLWYSLTALFCEQTRLHLSLELFAGKFSLSRFFLSLSGYPTVWVAISCYLPQIVLRAFRPGPYPTCNLCFPVQHLFAGDGCDCLGYFSAGVVVRHTFCGFPPPLLCCPLRFQKSP